MREVTSQELNDCGINPFAATLLVESWQGHPNPKPVAFLVRGVKFAMGYDPHELLAVCKQAHEAMELDFDNETSSQPYRAAMMALASVVAKAVHQAK